MKPFAPHLAAACVFAAALASCNSGTGPAGPAATQTTASAAGESMTIEADGPLQLDETNRHMTNPGRIVITTAKGEDHATTLATRECTTKWKRKLTKAGSNCADAACTFTAYEFRCSAS